MVPFCFVWVLNVFAYPKLFFFQAAPLSFRRETSCEREASSVHAYSHDAPTGTHGHPQFKRRIPRQLPAKGWRLRTARRHHHWYGPFTCSACYFLLRLWSLGLFLYGFYVFAFSDIVIPGSNSSTDVQARIGAGESIHVIRGSKGTSVLENY